MIHAITGKPGGGKSLWMVRRLLEVLVEDPDCQVITNLPLKVGELNALCQKRWPKLNLRTCERVTILDEEDVKQFWRHRGNVLDSTGTVIERVAVVEEMGGDGVAVQYTTAHPCVYFLDEFHLAFNAREWAKTGKGGLWYASQHRKRGDDVFWCTQYSENVDKQFRVLTQDWTTCRNWGNETWLKWLKPPMRFQHATSLEPPTVSRRTSQSWSIMPLDVEIAGCYDTMAGSGVRGTTAPQRLKRKGIPLWAGAVVFLAVLFGVVVGGPMLLGKGIGYSARAIVESTQVPAREAVATGVTLVPSGGASSQVAGSVLATGAVPGIAAPFPPAVPPVPEPLRVTMVSPTGRGFLVGLSDGRILRSGRDRALEWIAVGERRLLLDGEELTW